MKTLALSLALGLAGCVSAAANSSQGSTPKEDASKVKVYQAELETKDSMVPPLPEGCKLVGQSGPIDQEQQAFEISNPYQKQRENTAALGGNVLYVPFYRFKNLMKLDCPVGDSSPGCMDRSQSWYKVTFRSYSCDEPALQALAESPLPTTPAVFRIEFKKKPAPAATAAAAPAPAPVSSAATATAAAPGSAPASVSAPVSSASRSLLKEKILALVQEGVGVDVIVSYARANRPNPSLTADEIIDWKKSGIPDAVIAATFSQ
jgi:hypothetical protein